ncbi:MAG: insulinase family protein, partial [Pseudoalteromonas sp.]
EFYNTETFVKYVTSQLEKLSLADVNRVIKENLQTDDIQYVFITGDGKDMKKRLASEQTSPMVYNAEKPAELVAEDKVIADYTLSIPAKNIEVLAVDKVFE